MARRKPATTTHPAIAGVALLALTLSGSGASRVGAQDPGATKYLLPDLSAAGDVRSVEDVLDMSMDMTVSVEGQESAAKFSQRSREAYTETIVAVDAEGAPTMVKRAYTVAREAETPPMGKTVVRVSSLQGKTVTIRIAGDQVAVTADKGMLAPEDVKELQGKFGKNAEPEFIPQRELALGEEWVLDGAALGSALKGLEKGGIRGKLERIFPKHGHSLAEVRFNMQLHGTPEGAPLPLTMKGAGTGIYDLTLKRERDMQFSGPVTTEGEIEENGHKLKLKGEGKMNASTKVQWLKVAGKPVPPVAR